ncbi:MAG TPA: glycosyl transferase [Cyanobacteria bacterium UBA11049]|nr:glycosyl transferase [Cyanobacteria bacterium UBA11049]
MAGTALKVNQSNSNSNLRIAWLLPSAFFYWQPAISKLAQMFPQTTVFTGLWQGFAPGFENTFAVEVLERKIIQLSRTSTGYGNNFTYLPLNIVNRLLRFKPHLIFTSSFGIWTMLALLLKPLAKWRVVIAYEGSSPSVDFRGSALRLALRRAMVKAADALITNSHAGKAYLIDILKAKENNVFHQPYEVPATTALVGCTKEDKQSNLHQLQRPVFLFVGGIIPRKGLHLLLEACVVLQKQGYRNYTLLVVGDGAQRQELEAFSENHALADCVKWAGRVDYGNLGAYFNSADVFVLPTLEDTWGVVVLEAMALGKAVLCSKRAGAAEMVIEGENGYLFEPQQPEELAKVMSRFIEQPNLSVSMGDKSQQLMAQHTPEVAAQFLAKVTSFVVRN